MQVTFLTFLGRVAVPNQMNFRKCSKGGGMGGVEGRLEFFQKFIRFGSAIRLNTFQIKKHKLKIY